MTRRFALAAFGLAIASAAQADGPMFLNPDGTGQALYVPYYTTTDGQATLLSVTNQHATDTKAVAIRFLEGTNGRWALSFNIYLPPGDTWTGAVIESEGVAAIARPAEESTCTVPAPAAFATPRPLTTYAFSGDNDDGYPGGLQRTLTGAVEIIELGVLEGDTANLATAGNGCDALVSRFDEAAAWDVDPNADVTAPTGRLTARADIIDVEAGIAHSVPVKAIDNFATVPRHSLPSEHYVRLTDPAHGADGQGPIEVLLGAANGGGIATYSAAQAADAVSALFMTESLAGEYSVEQALAAETSWILSFPTHHAYLDDKPGGSLPVGSGVRAPFTAFAGECDVATVALHGRDGSDAPTGAPAVAPVCRQVQPLHFAHADAVWTSDVDETAPVFATPVSAGTAKIDFRNLVTDMLPPERPALSGPVALRGLPVVAFGMTRYLNANAQPGLLASFTTTAELIRESTHVD